MNGMKNPTTSIPECAQALLPSARLGDRLRRFLAKWVSRKLGPLHHLSGGSHGEDTVEALKSVARGEYQKLVRNFAETTKARGYEKAAKYYYYHTIDLGNGLVTPGDYDFRPVLPLFQFPADMQGMNVLDVGSATGFFAFEFERRGAEVTSVELPSIADWDMSLGDKATTLNEIKAWCGTDDLAAADEQIVHGGFDFCHRMLNSRVKRCLSSIYDLTPEKVRATGFDLVFMGDLLVHTMAPLMGLNAVANLCRGTLIISQDLVDVGGDSPVMLYCGGETRGVDDRSWWLPNKTCWVHMLKRLGFRDVRVIGSHEGVVRRHWIHYRRSIIHATR